MLASPGLTDSVTRSTEFKLREATAIMEKQVLTYSPSPLRTRNPGANRSPPMALTLYSYPRRPLLLPSPMALTLTLTLTLTP